MVQDYGIEGTSQHSEGHDIVASLAPLVLLKQFRQVDAQHDHNRRVEQPHDSLHHSLHNLIGEDDQQPEQTHQEHQQDADEQSPGGLADKTGEDHIGHQLSAAHDNGIEGQRHAELVEGELCAVVEHLHYEHQHAAGDEGPIAMR